MPKTKEQYEQIKLERRNAILKGALYLFALNGYESTTSDQVSKYVGCSHGLLYHYFKSKEDLFKSLHNELIITKHKDLIKNVDFNANPKFVLIDLLDSYVNALQSKDEESACVIYLLLNMHLQRKTISKIKNLEEGPSIRNLLFETIQKGIKEGRFYDNNPNETTIAMLAMLKGLSFTRIHMGYKLFQCPSSDIISRLIIK